MRLRLFVCISLVLLSPFAIAHGQTAAPLSPRRFGVLAGINTATLAGRDVQAVSRHTAFMVGALVVAPLTTAVALQPEMLYTTKGAESNSGSSSTLKMNYLEIPVLARFDIAGSGGTKPFVYAGPAVSFKMGCSIGATTAGSAPTLSCAEIEAQSNGSTKFTAVDYGVIIGGGTTFDLSGRTFTVGARYDHSLRNITRDAVSKHRVLSVLATYEFPWKQ